MGVVKLGRGSAQFGFLYDHYCHYSTQSNGTYMVITGTLCYIFLLEWHHTWCWWIVWGWGSWCWSWCCWCWQLDGEWVTWNWIVVASIIIVIIITSCSNIVVKVLGGAGAIARKWPNGGAELLVLGLAESLTLRSGNFQSVPINMSTACDCQNVGETILTAILGHIISLIECFTLPERKSLGNGSSWWLKAGDACHAGEGWAVDSAASKWIKALGKLSSGRQLRSCPNIGTGSDVSTGRNQPRPVTTEISLIKCKSKWTSENRQ